MIRAYTIASGKGGTGKTTCTINLGASLAKLGLETFIMDADIGMANIGLLLGLEDAPITIHEVLAGKAKLEETIQVMCRTRERTVAAPEGGSPSTCSKTPSCTSFTSSRSDRTCTASPRLS